MQSFLFTITVFFVISAVANDQNLVAEDPNTLRFLAIGDQGGSPNPLLKFTTTAQKKVSDSMANIIRASGAEFVIGVGDNFYEFGVKTANDVRFKDTFEDIYHQPELQKRWYIIAGNHDHYGNVDAELEYAKTSNRWYMPNLYYTETLHIPNTDKSVQFIFLDTIILAGLSHDGDMTQPKRLHLSEADKQLEWLEETLASSTAHWKIVVGHYPVYSVAEHGPTDFLITNMAPLLKKYDVALYLCGHDHSLQHLSSDNIEYVVCGAGCKTDGNRHHASKVPSGSLKYAWGPDSGTISGNHHNGGFSYFEVSQEAIKMTFYDQDGNVLYNMQKNK